ncbi:YggS family pyridoxal phosphate-dependent enzyme [Pseudoalteromonas sp.]|uniref:YggS family pyridoxal phosphate-dependent enzyme n=1 Tax=Pseudoalteromonas sp. TaxID=53249 RepID=UPI0035613FEE
MITIAERLKIAYSRIAKAIKNSHISEQKVALLAVSKTKSSTLIREAYNSGQRQFGESYVQEAVEKIVELSDLNDIEWHFIGPIQSNKTALVAANFDWVQSIDRIKIAQRLNAQRPQNLSKLNVLIQINIDDEDSKSGCKINEVAELAAYIATADNLVLRGVMAIPKKSEAFEEQQTSFAKLKACFTQLKSQYPTIDTLSMGMSNDVEAAISQGSTMVRIGTDIFGPRN